MTNTETAPDQVEMCVSTLIRLQPGRKAQSATRLSGVTVHDLATAIARQATRRGPLPITYPV